MGVVLWEMVTMAAQPYLGLTNEEVLNYVCHGGRMDKPEGCPNQLYELMLMCWRQQPKDRPTFCEIIEILVPYLQPDFRDVSFFFSRENQELMAASRHNQASTITLDFSSLCRRTDVDAAYSSEHDRQSSSDAHTPLLVGGADSHRQRSVLADDDLDLDSETPDLTPPKAQTWLHGSDRHAHGDESNNCECVELQPTSRTTRNGNDRLPHNGSSNVHGTHANKGADPRNGLANGHLPYHSHSTRAAQS
jgi:hypothetical protein